MYIETLLNLPLPNRFTYLVDESMSVEVGMRVQVPFGRRKLTAYVVKKTEHIEKQSYEIRPIIRVIDKEPLFGQSEIELAQWMAKFYLCSEGEALSAMIPGGRREIESKALQIDDSVDRIIAEEELLEQQRGAIEAILGSEKEMHYLYGVTGSGKSEVFFHVASQIIEQGAQVIYLVPEITLTVQLAQQVKLRFKERVAVLHSALTPSQRLYEWRRILKGEVDIAIGARSAIFAPFNNLKLIIIDEEHENSYKASSTPRYHARQVAQKRSMMSKAKIVMGSATPSLEAYQMMEVGKIERHLLPVRVAGGKQPTISVVNMLAEKNLLSRKLVSEIQRSLSSEKQVILFLNRRGYSHFFHCNSCGYEMKCPHCSVSLTYHKQRGRMVCHYCGQERLPVTTCPQCNSVDVGYGSFGTEMVEQEVKTFFPDARIERLDTDVAKKKDHVATVLTQFQSGEIDILLGTQMVAKGLNFPKVDLVGIVLADSGLNLPDFRSQERTFSLITQVSGRSGRFSTEGKVIVQTFHPDNPAIKLATEAKGDEFYTQELQMRKATLFPPFSRLVNFVIRGRNQQKCKEAIESLRKVISASIEALERENLPKSTLPTLLGASLCPIEKIAGNWRYHLLLRGENPALVLRIANYVYTNFKLSGQLYIEIDVDPLSLL